MGRVDQGKISEEQLHSIPGNAPIAVKGAPHDTCRPITGQRLGRPCCWPSLTHRLTHGLHVRLFVALVRRWLEVFADNGFGTRTTQHLDIVEVSIVPKVDEPTRQETRVVLEMTVTQGLTPTPIGARLTRNAHRCLLLSCTFIYL